MKPTILILNSPSQHFPLDVQSLLQKAGHESHRLPDLNAFISSPLRAQPFLAVLEVGTLEDIDRALLAFEWAESVQPLAAGRFLLLLGSKHIQLGDRAGRFRGVEIAQWPLPPKNLVFKLELQLRLLVSEPKIPERPREGFLVEFTGPERERVMVMRGPGAREGSWKPTAIVESGKTRWRWVKGVEAPVAANIGLSWIAESAQAPVFDEKRGEWRVKDAGADLVCVRGKEEIFSARKIALARPEGESAVLPGQSQGGAHESSAVSTNRANEPGHLPGRDDNRDTHEPGNTKLSAGTMNQTESVSTYTTATPAAKSLATSDATTVNASERASQLAAPPRLQMANLSEHITEAATTPNTASASAAASVKVEDAATQPPAAVEEEAGEISRSASLPREKNETTDREKPVPHPDNRGSLRVRRKTELSQTEESAPLPDQPTQTDTAVGELGHAERAEKRQKNRNAPAVADDSFSTDEQLKQKSREERERKAAARATKAPQSVSDAASATDAAEKAQQVAEESNTARREKLKRSEDQSLDHAEGEDSFPAGEARRTDEAHVGGTAAEGFDKIVLDSGRGQAEAKERSEPGGRSDKPVPVRVVEGQGETEDPERYLKMRLFLTLTLEELGDDNSSWHPLDGYRIYLSAQHRYYGLKNVDDIFPLWVYEGELAPEFLESKQAWKFYDRLPLSYTGWAGLPKPVEDFLRQIQGEGGRIPLRKDPAAATQDEADRRANEEVLARAARQKNRARVMTEKSPGQETRKYGAFLSFLRRIFGLE